MAKQGKIFTLSDTTIKIMENAIDDIILFLGKDCKVVYPPNITPCTNCVLDPVGGKSRNIYIHGGPMEFPANSICPMCDGTGAWRAEETSEIVHVIVNWNPKEFKNIRLDQVRLSNGVIHVKGHISDLPKFQQMNYFIPHIDIADYGDFRFVLKTEPYSAGNIVQGKYFEALLDRSAS